MQVPQMTLLKVNAQIMANRFCTERRSASQAIGRLKTPTTSKRNSCAGEYCGSGPNKLKRVKPDAFTMPTANQNNRRCVAVTAATVLSFDFISVSTTQAQRRRPSILRSSATAEDGRGAPIAIPIQNRG